MNYDEFIHGIIDTRGQHNTPEDQYKEMHHIVPRCVGGLPERVNESNSKHENIIWLTGAEHFVAHKLLLEKYPDNVKLAQAFWLMSHIGNSNYEVSPEDYELAKSLFSHSDEDKQKISKGLAVYYSEHESSHKGCILTEEHKLKVSEGLKTHYKTHESYKRTEETKQKTSNALKGHKLSQESINKMKETLKEKYPNGTCPKHSEETKQHLKDTWHETHGDMVTDELRLKHSILSSGENNGMYGKHNSEEAKSKQSNKAKESYANGRVPNGARSIVCVETKEVFITMKTACEKMHMNRQTLKSCIENKTPNSKGLHFRYLKEVN